MAATPASCALSTTSERSALNRGSLRWAWLSIIPTILFHPAPGGNGFGYAHHFQPSIGRSGGQEHALGQLAPEFSRFEVLHHNDAFTHQIVRLVVLGNTGHNLPLFASDIHLQLQEPVGTLNPRGLQNLSNHQ